MGGNAIAAAASQAIAATQQLSGRRSSSLKASYEAINLGVQANEFSIGRELAGAAQAAIASTSFETQVRAYSKNKMREKILPRLTFEIFQYIRGLKKLFYIYFIIQQLCGQSFVIF